MTEETKTPEELIERARAWPKQALSLGPSSEALILELASALATSQARQRELEGALREWVVLKNLLGADSYDGIEPRYVEMLDDLASRSRLLNSPAGEQPECPDCPNYFGKCPRCHRPRPRPTAPSPTGGER